MRGWWNSIRFFPTMTLYFTIILAYCRVQLKKMAGLSPGSKVLTPLNHLPVTGSWNWSTWANGDLPYYWPDVRDMGNFSNAPYQVQAPFLLLETDMTSSKMVDGSGNGACAWYGALEKFPILLTGQGLRQKSPSYQFPWMYTQEQTHMLGHLVQVLII